MPANAIVTRVPESMRWTLKQAAIDQRTSSQKLVHEILSDWLRERGYLSAEAQAEVEAQPTE
jgi:hypothetical protein